MKCTPTMAAIAIMASPASQVSARDRISTTWARSGVSYDQYKADSVDCAYAGYFRDVARDDPAKRFITGWRAADTALNMPGGNGDGYISALKRTQPDRKLAAVQALQTSDVQKCLVKRGYHEAVLTRSEIKKLRTLDKGSEARRRYLHAIASR